jgi:hypothetical protein
MRKWLQSMLGGKPAEPAPAGPADVTLHVPGMY